MSFEYLDKEGCKSLKNVLNFLIKPSTIQKSLHKRYSTPDFRHQIITKVIPNLKDDDMNKLLEDISHSVDIQTEIAQAFQKNMLDYENALRAFSFLKRLIDKANEKTIKQELIHSCIVQSSENSVIMLLDEKDSQVRSLYKDEFIKYKPELAFVLLTYNREDFTANNELGRNELIKAIYIVQKQTEEGILETVLNKHENGEELLAELEKRVKEKDFEILYLLSMNPHIFDKELAGQYNAVAQAVKKVIDYIQHKNNDVGLDELVSYLVTVDLSIVIFILKNLLALEYKSSGILAETILQKLDNLYIRFDCNEMDQLNQFILDSFKLMNNSMQDVVSHWFRHSKYDSYMLYKLIDIVKSVKISMKTEKCLIDIIRENAGISEENKIVDLLNNTNETNIKNLDDFQEIPFVLILNNHTIEKNIDILRKLQKMRKDLFAKVLTAIENLAVKNLIDNNKYLRIFFLNGFEPNKNEAKKACEELRNNNPEVYYKFIQRYDQDEYMTQLNKRVDELIKSFDLSGIRSVLEAEIHDNLKQELSMSIFNKLFCQNNFGWIIQLWDNLKFGISMQINLMCKIKKHTLDNQEYLNKDIINFFIEKGIDDIDTYFEIKDDNLKEVLLGKWNMTDKSGKVIDVIKHMLSSGLRSFKDLEQIKQMVNKYNINDYKLSSYMRMKAYSLIETSLFELKANDVDLMYKLNYVIDYVTEFNLEDRLIEDDFLMEQLEPAIARSIPKILLEKSDSEKTIKSFWTRTEQSIEERNLKEVEKQLEVMIPFVAHCEKRLEWFLDKLDMKKYDTSIMTLIIEICFRFINKYKISINQYEIEKKQQNVKQLYEIAQVTGNSLNLLEKTIMNMNENSAAKNVLVNQIKLLRRDLASKGIRTVEDAENYGRVVEFDSDKHKSTFLSMGTGIVASLGIKIGDENVILSELIIEDMEVKANE